MVTKVVISRPGSKCSVLSY